YAGNCATEGLARRDCSRRLEIAAGRPIVRRCHDRFRVAQHAGPGSGIAGNASNSDAERALARARFFTTAKFISSGDLSFLPASYFAATMRTAYPRQGGV